MDYYFELKSKDEDNKYRWKEEKKEKSFWEIFETKDLQINSKKSANLPSILFGLFTNKEFKNKMQKIFFGNFIEFYEESLLFFESILEIYQVPSGKMKQNEIIELKNGVVEVISSALVTESQFQEVFHLNKILQKRAIKFAEKLEESHAKIILESIEKSLSLRKRKNSNYWIESPTPSSFKLKKKNFLKELKIENYLLGNIEIFDIDPLFLSVNLYYINKSMFSEIPLCELQGMVYHSIGNLIH